MGKEDFSTYTEVDASNYVNVGKHNIDFTAMSRDDDAYVYKDKGAAHFDGDFTHHLACNVSNIGTVAHAYPWALANSVDNIKGITDASGDALSIILYGGGGTPTLYLREIDGGVNYDDTYVISTGTTYYLEIERDESVGTYGTIYCRVYSDPGRTTLLSTLSVTLHSSKKDFRYVYGLNNYNDSVSGGIREVTGWTQNLNLEEAAALGKFYHIPGLGDFSDPETGDFYHLPGGGDLKINSVLTSIVRTKSLTLGSLIQAQGVTRATSLNAAIQKVIQLTTDIDSVLAKKYEKTISVNAAIKKAEFLIASINGLLQGIGAVTTGADAAILSTESVTNNIDAKLQKVITLTASLDAVLATAGVVSITADINALLQKSVSITASINAVIKQTGVEITANIDSVLQKTYSVTIGLDATLQKQETLNSSVEAKLQKAEMLITSINGLLQDVGTTTTGISGLLQKSETITNDVSAAIQKAISLTASLDAVLIDLGATYTITTGVNAILQEASAIIISVNALIKRLDISKTLSADAVLQKNYSLSLSLSAILSEVMILTTGINACLQKQLTTSADVSALLQKTVSLNTSCDAVIGLSGILSAGINALLFKTGNLSTATVNAILSVLESILTPIERTHFIAFDVRRNIISEDDRVNTIKTDDRTKIII